MIVVRTPSSGGVHRFVYVLEGTHPIGSIRRQAGELKYIAEAPRLELEEDEYVDVPAGEERCQQVSGIRESGWKIGKTKGAKNVHRRGDGESELRQVRAESVTTERVDCCSHRISFVRRVRNEMICNKLLSI